MGHLQYLFLATYLLFLHFQESDTVSEELDIILGLLASES